MTAWPDDDVILYDGVCIFCSRWVRFVATRDVERRFRFTADPVRLRHAAGAGFRHQPRRSRHQRRRSWRRRLFQIRRGADGAGALPGWGWTRALFAVPKPLRDGVYSLVARNRYRIFGKYEECFVPDADMRARVME